MQVTREDWRMQQAVDELQRLIRGQYPDATFAVKDGEDPAGTYLVATVDTEDITEVIELVSDRLVTMQVDERLPLYVVPVHTPERTAARLRALAHHGRTLASAALHA